MNFDMIRFGWPNTAAIAALAVMPFMALTMPAPRQPFTVQTEQVELAAMCPVTAGCLTIAANPVTFIE
ncbi:MAG: hypothetical protein WCG92_01510 [Hyphomicrobiales bacterium]|nr:hypothetical protein [Alphaproteobacteria bacterium]